MRYLSNIQYRELEIVKRFIFIFIMLLFVLGLSGTALATQNRYQVADGSTDPASFDAAQGSTDNYINMWSGSLAGTCIGVTDITVTTINTADIAKVTLADDTGTPLASQTTPVGNDWTITYTLGAVTDYRILVDIKGGATVTNTVTAYVTLVTVDGSCSNGATYGDAAGTTLTITAGGSCVRVAPTFSMGGDKSISASGSAVYTLSIENNDNGGCSDSDWAISIDSETGDTASFTLASIISSTPVTISEGVTDTSVTFTVTGDGSGVGGDNIISTVRITDATYHNGQDQTDPVTTTISTADPAYEVFECSHCHNYPPSDAPATRNTPEGAVLGSHSTHVKTKGFECIYCHTDTTTGETVFPHRNSFINMTSTLRNGGSYSRGTSFAQSNNPPLDTCINTWCHGALLDAGAQGAKTDPTWGTSAHVYCGSCHKTDSTMAQGAHQKHILTYSIDCPYCHTSDAAVTHVDGGVTFKLGGTLGATTACADCHFNGADNAKYDWYSTTVPTTQQTCDSCHFDATDTDDFTYTNITSTSKVVARIASGEWTTSGHANTGGFSSGNPAPSPALTCDQCHDSSKDHQDFSTGNNPFRLYTADVVALCKNCHGTGGDLDNWGITSTATLTDILSHNDTNVDNGNQNFSIKCPDCHDPHGDSNWTMMHEKVHLPTGANSYIPSDAKGVPFGTYTNVYFTDNTAGGYASAVGADADGLTNMCNTCHSRTFDSGETDQRYQRDMAGGPWSTHSDGLDCGGCHKHGTGFKGVGGSSGGQDCIDCHNQVNDPLVPLFGPMTSDGSYHHVMVSTDASGYPDSSSGSMAVDDVRKTCLMCHVDHDDVRPDQAGNLRRSASAAPGAGEGINSDFYPINNRYGASPVDPADGTNGVCIGCHGAENYENQLKNQDNRGANDGSQKARSFSLSLYTSSSHNFQTNGNTNSWGDASQFRANCSKCHGSYEFSQAGQTSTEKFGLHDSKYQSLNRPNGRDPATTGNPLGKKLCYSCHGKGYQSSFDYFSTIEMGSGHKMLEAAIEAKPGSGHPVGATSNHDPAEFYNATSEGWQDRNGWHVECVDCHNTHGGNASIVRNVGESDGNLIAGAQKGVWGVDVSFGAVGTQPTYAQKTQVTKQYEMCAKCHTQYGWGGGTPPDVPSGGDGVNTLFTDVMKEFNTANYGYHPVVGIGKNQPPVATWEAATGKGSGTVGYINELTGIDTHQTKTVEGLGWAFIPPWNTQSTMGCTDCHQSDSTGKAEYPPEVSVIVDNWGGSGANLANKNGVPAVSVPGNIVEIDLNGTVDYTATDFNLYMYGITTNNNNDLIYRIKQLGTPIPDTSWVDFRIDDLASEQWFSQSVWATLSGAGCTTPACISDEITIEVDSDSSMDIDKLELRASFSISSLRGPHGSMKGWILGSANENIAVDWNGGTSYVYPNAGVSAVLAEENTVCWNCHRRDVYNTIAANANYSRFNHPLFTTGGAGSDVTVFADYIPGRGGAAGGAIWCMMCHGGGRLGAIHGDWQNKQWRGNTFPGNERNAGVRLMNGATASLQADTSTDGIQCWTAGGFDGIGGCTKHDGGGTTDTYANAFNYVYY